MRNRSFIFGVLAVAAMLNASAQTVALFYDGCYVATNATASSEAYNLKHALEAMGFVVKPFGGTSSNDFATALASVDVLVVPELKLGDLGSDLPEEIIPVVARFAESGHTLVVHGENRGMGNRFVNRVFGHVLRGDCSAYGSIKSDHAKGTIFEGGPSFLEGVNSLFAWEDESLPEGSFRAYGYSREADYTTVAVIPEGSGRIVLLAWDWYNAVPEGRQDGGWNEVLGRIIGSSTDALPGVRLADAGGPMRQAGDRQ